MIELIQYAAGVVMATAAVVAACIAPVGTVAIAVATATVAASLVQLLWCSLYCCFTASVVYIQSTFMFQKRKNTESVR